MPIYEYRCRKCGYEMEVLQGIKESDLKDCPECKTSNLEKCMSLPSVRFAGSGYYETDEKPKSKQRNVAVSTNEGASCTTPEKGPCQKAVCNTSN